MKEGYKTIFILLFILGFVLQTNAQSNISITVSQVQNELHDYGYDVGYLQFTYTPPEQDTWLSIGAQDEDTFDFGIIVENVYLPSSETVGTDPMTITIPFNISDLAPYTDFNGSASNKKTTRSTLRLYIHALTGIGFYPFAPSTFIFEAVVAITIINIVASNGIYQGAPPEEGTGETVPHVEGENLVKKVIRTTEMPIIDLDGSANGPSVVYPGGDSEACVPASVSNSVMWMADKYKDEFELPDGMTHRDVLRELSNRMNREANKGVPTDSTTIVGKLDFFEDLEIKNIEVKFQSVAKTGTTPAERNFVSTTGESRARNLNSRADGKPQWDFLEKMMEDGEDVEIGTVFYTKDPQSGARIAHGHTMTVSGIERYENGKKVVWVSDDENQSKTDATKLTKKPLDVVEWNNGHFIIGGQFIVTSIIAESPVPLDGRETAAFINELFGGSNNKLPSSSASSFVEIALQSTVTDLENYLITIYDGADGAVHKTFTLDEFTIGSSESGYNIYSYELSSGDLPTPNGGIAVSYTGSVIEYQFISYGGEFYATEGDAAYMYSNDIGEFNPSESFYLSGYGFQYSGFSWGTSSSSSPGQINEGQTFTTDIPAVPTLLSPTDEQTGLSTEVEFTWASDFANYYDIQIAEDNSFTSVIDESKTTDDQYTTSGLVANTTYYWRVNASNSNGESGYSETRSFVVGVTDVSDGGSLPKEFFVKQNYPNPFNPSTKVDYGLAADSEVEVSIFNILGQIVKQEYFGSRKAGYYSYNWDASELPSGIYIFRLNAISSSQTNNFTKSIKMLFIK